MERKKAITEVGELEHPLLPLQENSIPGFRLAHSGR